jgi:hypothetical protein
VIRRLRFVAVAAVVASPLLVTVAAPHSDAAPRPVFNATAAATGARIHVETATIPLLGEAIVGLPDAQVSLTSLGQSQATAYLLDPSPGVATLPGLLATVGLDFIPPYPLVVNSADPVRPHDELQGGAYALTADSGPLTTTGIAVLDGGTGLSGSTSTASATFDEVAGSVTVDASSVTEGLSLADGVLAIGRVQSTATATFAPGGKVEFTTDLTAEALDVDGTAISISPDGVSVLGVELPLGPALAKAAFAAAGVDYRFLEPRMDEDGLGLTGAGIEFIYTVSDGLPDPVKVTLVVGRARVRLQANDDGQPPDEPELPGAAAGPAPDFTAPISGPAGVTPIVSAPGPVPPSPASRLVSTRIDVGFFEFDLTTFYLLIVIGAAVVGLSGRVFRYWGVDDRWIG